MQGLNLKIKLLLLAMTLVMVGLLTVQGFWFSEAYSLQDRQFSEQVNIALRNVADQLLKQQGDSLSQIQPIKRESSNTWYVPLGSTLKVFQLDSVLKKEFELRNIDLTFDYAVYERESQNIVLGNTVLPSLNPQPNNACRSRKQDTVLHDFKLRFTGQQAHLLGSMKIWIFSSFLMISVLGIFTFLMFSFLREKRVSQLKTSFVNNMTHELKTPITNITIASEVLLDPNSSADSVKKQRYTNIIHKETQRLKTLVDRVLQIAILEKGKLILNTEYLDINSLILECVNVASPGIEKEGGRLTHELEASEYSLKGDKHHLLNVMYNLVENGQKYSTDAPEITIRSRANAEWVTIEVLDQGIGIAPEEQKQIFGKFYRIPEGDLHSVNGYGLGLSYVALIVKEHGGSIQVKSEPGKGSCFTILLPIDHKGLVENG